MCWSSHKILSENRWCCRKSTPSLLNRFTLFEVAGGVRANLNAKLRAPKFMLGFRRWQV